MQAPAPIPVFRPSYLTDGVEFQGSLTESPANVFYQSVNASIASLNRMQFQWRSVSDQLLVSPVMMLRFKIRVTAACTVCKPRSTVTLIHPSGLRPILVGRLVSPRSSSQTGTP